MTYKNNLILCLLMSLTFLLEGSSFASDLKDPDQPHSVTPLPHEESLLKAASEGNVEEVKHLLEMGVALDKADKDGYTPLMIAAEQGHEEAAKLLLYTGSYKHAKNHKGESIETLARSRGHINIADMIRYFPNASYFTPLMTASLRSEPDIMRILFKRGVDLNETREKGRTALIFAASQGQTYELDLLLKEGAHIDVADQYGYTALMWAVMNVHFPAIRLLLSSGADKHKKTKDGRTAEDIAKSLDYAGLAQLIKSFHVKFHQTNK